MANTQQNIQIGTLGRSHGVHGWIKVHSHTEPKEQILNYANWQTDSGSALPLEDHRIQNNGTIIIKLKGCDSPELVKQRYTNLAIYINRAQLPPTAEGQYYWHDLVGCRVHNTDNDDLGTIDHLFDTVSNDAMVTVDGTKQRMIPWTQHVIKDVDLNTRTIRVVWDSDF